MRDAMSKKEYERTTTRADAADGEALLPVVVFSFSKTKCEEIADFFGGQVRSLAHKYHSPLMRSLTQISRISSAGRCDPSPTPVSHKYHSPLMRSLTHTSLP